MSVPTVKNNVNKTVRTLQVPTLAAVELAIGLTVMVEPAVVRVWSDLIIS